jgi:hypothetical protein
MQLRWIASTRASWAHAAAAIASGETLVDAQIAEQLAPPVAMVQKWLDEQGVPPAFWDHLPALATGIDRNDALALVALTKTVGRGRATEIASWLTALLREIEVHWLRLFPELTEQLGLRAQPLREQWEARGPGLLRTIGNWTEAGLLIEQADVALVQPALGGGGCAQLAYNSVRIEAVLTNPIEELPEVARLAWLLAQLNLDLPMYRELLTAAPTAFAPDRIGALAVLPPTLAAAAEVDLLRFEPATMRLAIHRWTGIDRDVNVVAENLLAWWETYRASRPPFAVALRALGEMLGQSSA